MELTSNADTLALFRIIDLTPENIEGYGVCGYKNVCKHLELQSLILNSSRCDSMKR